MVAIVVFFVFAVGLATAYCAWRFRDVRKFLAGAFLVSGGIQLYLYAAGVSVPFLGTDLVQTPEVGALRGTVHLALFVVCFVTGFFHKPQR